MLLTARSAQPSTSYTPKFGAENTGVTMANSPASSEDLPLRDIMGVMRAARYARPQADLETSEETSEGLRTLKLEPLSPQSDCSSHSGMDRYHPHVYQDVAGWEELLRSKENLPPTTRDGQNTGDDMFEYKLHMLASSLEAVEARSDMLSARVEASETETQVYAARLSESECEIGRMKLESLKRESSLSEEVAKLRGVIEAQQLASSVAEETLRQMIARERREADRLRSERDEALRQRADALLELGETACDMEAMQATLADCASYCQYLRSKCIELEMRTVSLAESRPQDDREGVFGLKKISDAIVKAVSDTKQLPEAERKKKIRQLLLRWHPDKNPVLKEFATEVSKIINEAVAEMEGEAAVGTSNSETTDTA